MTVLDQAVEQKQTPYLSAFARLEAELARIGHAGSTTSGERRSTASPNSAFRQLGMKSGNLRIVAAIAGIPFQQASSRGNLAVAEELIRDLPGGGNRLVFVNGSYAPGCRGNMKGERSSRVCGEALEEGKPELDRYLGPLLPGIGLIRLLL